MNNRKTIIITLTAEDGHAIFQKQLSKKLIKEILGTRHTFNVYDSEYNWQLLESIKPAAYLYMDSYDVYDADLRVINNYSGTVIGMWLHR